MKRIEKMTKEELNDFYKGMLKDNCADCLLYEECNNEPCYVVAHRYLFEDIPMKPRWQLCKTDEDMKELHRKWDGLGVYKPFIDYLMDKVEVEE